ncbi:hypothetical protein DFS33DRAFT_1371339 [Desarmillaria ectypa]|nr:hypothetical protein DFS33DRAFT_1371339 [Desarmillaria ectypa]
MTSTNASISSHDQVVTPWDVQGSISSDRKQPAIDYDKLIVMLQRFEKLTGKKPHVLLRRGLFFPHRDSGKLLDRYELGKPFFLYTGCSPGSGSVHLGRMVPFVFTKWLQDVFDVPLVVQLTDDVRFLFEQSLKPEQTKAFGRQNSRDIIAIGFGLSRTFIFVSRKVTYSQAKATFRSTDSDNIDGIHFAAVQAAPSFFNSFPQIYGTISNVLCIISCTIDQDPYFCPTRDVTQKLKYPTLMTFPAQTRNKMNKHSFPAITCLLEEDETVKIGEDYRACIEALQKSVGDFQEKRENATDGAVSAFMGANRRITPTLGKAPQTRNG